jgi:hypothetical protein
MSSFYDALDKWLTDNNWIGKYGSHKYSVITIPTAVSKVTTNDDNTLIKYQSGVWKYEVETTYDRDKDRLTDCTLYLLIPGYGRAPLLYKKTIPLKPKSSADYIVVEIPDTMVKGKVKYFYSKDKEEVLLSWNLTTPYTGADASVEDDGYSLFPTTPKSSFLAGKLQDVEPVNDSDALTLRELPLSQFQVVEGVSGKGVIYDKASEEELDNLIAKAFIHDHIKPGAQSVVLPKHFSVLSKEYSFDLHFLRVLELVGSILIADLTISATLYASLPRVGRVKLITIHGSLKGAGVTAKINNRLAKGSVTLYVKQNGSGSHDLYIKVDLTIKFIGHIGGDYKLVTLPF